MDVRFVLDMGVVVPGHGPRSEVQAAATQCLIVDQAWDPLAADDLVAEARIARAHWCPTLIDQRAPGADAPDMRPVGFCNEGHPGAEPVSVVTVPNAP